MESETLNATPRGETGSASCRRLRRDGLVPAVLYGERRDNLKVTVGASDLARVLRHRARVLDLSLEGGGTEAVVIKEMQWDSLGEQVMHVDFQRIDLTKTLRIRVQLALLGVPKGHSDGGVLEQLAASIEVECLPRAVPDRIEASVAGLGLNEYLRVKDLKLPEGVKAIDDPEKMVAACHPPRLEAEPTVEAVEAAPTEPERIVKEKPAAEEEEK